MSEQDYYNTISNIDKLSVDEFRRRISVLNRVANEQSNQVKNPNPEWYSSFYELLLKYKGEAVKRKKNSNDKKDLDAQIQINNAVATYNSLQYEERVTTRAGSVDGDKDDPLPFTDSGFKQEPIKKTKYRGGEQKTTAPAQGETYTVKPTDQTQSDIVQDYNKASDKNVKESLVDKALKNAKDLGGDDGTIAYQAQEFINNSNYDELNKEMQEIRLAQDLLQKANKDAVIDTLKFRDQYQTLDTIKEAIMKAPRYKAPSSQPPLEPKVEPKVEPQLETVLPVKQDTAPQGQVEDIPLSGSDLIQEANNYIGEINKVPAFRLNSKMINIRKELQNAIKQPINQEKLRMAVEKSRQFFANIDQNLNKVPDRSEVAGRAIDQGLDDMKKIEEQNKQAKEAKTKLTDLRPEAKEGEELRVKKNFNKDVLELKTANDVLKSQVNIQREEIKVLKESIEQKLAKENQSMLSGVAPVFRHYLSLEIENVIQESEDQEQVYYSVI